MVLLTTALAVRPVVNNWRGLGAPIVSFWVLSLLRETCAAGRAKMPAARTPRAALQYRTLNKSSRRHFFLIAIKCSFSPPLHCSQRGPWVVARSERRVLFARSELCGLLAPARQSPLGRSKGVCACAFLGGTSGTANTSACWLPPVSLVQYASRCACRCSICREE